MTFLSRLNPADGTFCGFGGQFLAVWFDSISQPHFDFT